MNLMAVDAQRVMQLVQSLNQLWSAPFQICVAIYFLYVTMGVAVLAGLGMLIMLIPLNLLITRLARKIQVITAVYYYDGMSTARYLRGKVPRSLFFLLSILILLHASACTVCFNITYSQTTQAKFTCCTCTSEQAHVGAQARTA